mgnify:CR=1 FL=1
MHTVGAVEEAGGGGAWGSGCGCPVAGEQWQASHQVQRFHTGKAARRLHWQSAVSAGQEFAAVGLLARALQPRGLWLQIYGRLVPLIRWWGVPSPLLGCGPAACPAATRRCWPATCDVSHLRPLQAGTGTTARSPARPPA